MSISSTDLITYVVGDGTTGTIETPAFESSSDIKVLVRESGSATATQWVLNTHYTLSGAGTGDNGTLTPLVVKPLNAEIVVYTDPDFKLTADFTSLPTAIQSPLTSALNQLAIMARSLKASHRRMLKTEWFDAIAKNNTALIPIDTSRGGDLFSWSTSLYTPTVTDPDTLTGGATQGVEMDQLTLAAVGTSDYFVFRDVSGAADFGVTIEQLPVTPGLTFDGTSDQSTALQALITADIAAGRTYRAIVSGPGGTLALNSSITIANIGTGRPYVLDFSRCEKINRTAASVSIKVQGAEGSSVLFSSDGDRYDTTINTATAPSGAAIVAGSMVICRDDSDCSDIDGVSSSRIAEDPRRVTSVTSSTVVLDHGIDHPMTTAQNAEVTYVTPSEDVTIICPPEEVYTVAASGTIPLYEFKWAAGCRLVRPRLIDTKSTHTTNGPLLKATYCLDIGVVGPTRVGKIDPSDATSGNRLGIEVISSRGVGILGGSFTRCRYGIVCQNAADVVDAHSKYYDCLIAGFKTNGCRSVRCVSTDGHYIHGASLAPTWSVQPAIVFGDSANLAGDWDCGVVGATMEGFDSAWGAIRIGTPCDGIFTQRITAIDGDDIVTLAQFGADNGGTLYLSELVGIRCGGHAVDDTTTTVAFTEILLGITQLDSTASSEHNVGFSGAATRPFLSSAAGTPTFTDVTLTTTPVTLDPDVHGSMLQSGADNVYVRVFAAHGTPATAMTINLPASWPAGVGVHIVVPHTQTGTVTVACASGGAYDDTDTSKAIMAPISANIDRTAYIECIANAGSAPRFKASGYFVASAYLLDANTTIDGTLDVTGAFGQHAREIVEIDNGDLTSNNIDLDETYLGKVIHWIGSNASATITLDPATASHGDYIIKNRGTSVCQVLPDGGTGVSLAVDFAIVVSHEGAGAFNAGTQFSCGDFT